MQRALEINATNQWNTADMGNILSYLGRAEEGVVWLNRARQIDPYFDPPWYWQALGRARMLLRHYEEAIAAFERPLLRPFEISAYLAGCYARLGANDRARAYAADCLQKRPDFTIGRWMAKVPFKNPADAEHLVESLRAAGLAE